MGILFILSLGLPGLVLAFIFSFAECKHTLSGFSLTDKTFSMDQLLAVVFATILLSVILVVLALNFADPEIIALAIPASVITLKIAEGPTAIIAYWFLKKPKTVSE